MTIPIIEQTLLPILNLLSDKNEHGRKEIIASVAEHFKLTKNEVDVVYPGKYKQVFGDRVDWALLELKNAGAIKNTKLGHYQITKKGLSILEKSPDMVNRKILSQQ